MDITGDLRGVEQAIAELDQMAAAAPDAAHKALTRCALLVHRDAKRNAPRSPSAKILKALRTTSRRTHRKDRATSRPSPGGLERSIEWEVATFGGGVNASVFVSANSEAGKYAARIHDEKGSTWSHRGPGTIQKGARADAWFIERAVKDNEGNMMDIIRSEMDKVIK